MDNAAKANVMGTKSIGRLLISFSIPAILGMVIVAPAFNLSHHQGLFQ